MPHRHTPEIKHSLLQCRRIYSPLSCSCFPDFHVDHLKTELVDAFLPPERILLIFINLQHHRLRLPTGIFFLSLSHSRISSVSPACTSKSARHSFTSFLPETSGSKFSFQTFLCISAIKLLTLLYSYFLSAISNSFSIAIGISKMPSSPVKCPFFS